jgi:hypothetical protein
LGGVKFIERGTEKRPRFASSIERSPVTCPIDSLRTAGKYRHAIGCHLEGKLSSIGQKAMIGMSSAHHCHAVPRSTRCATEKKNRGSVFQFAKPLRIRRIVLESDLHLMVARPLQDAFA